MNDIEADAVREARHVNAWDSYTYTDTMIRNSSSAVQLAQGYITEFKDVNSRTA